VDADLNKNLLRQRTIQNLRSVKADFDKLYLGATRLVITVRVEVKILSEELKEVGWVSHFFAKISVAVIELKASISVGDRIFIKGPTTSIEQTVESIEIEHEKVQRAEAGQSIGMKVNDRVRENDIVYKKA